MEKIIDPVPVELLKQELTEDKKLTDTSKGHNELYVVTWHNAPNVTTEIGRLREEAFRAGGGSTGNAIDLDEYDKMEVPYKQLVIWDPDAEAIMGGFRFLLGSEARFEDNGQPILASAHQFQFSQQFIDEYLPHIVETGRLFVAPEYQSTKAGAKSIFAFDNLWDGMGAIIMQNPEVLYYFGKATIYPSYDRLSRDLIYYFMWKHFKDDQQLIRPWPDIDVMPETPAGFMDLLLTSDDVREDYRLLKNAIRQRGTCIPPNLSAFISVTPDLLMCGTAVNRLMHNIEDTAILIPFDDIYYDKKARHVGTFLKSNRRLFVSAEEENKVIDEWLNERETLVRKILRRMRDKRRKRLAAREKAEKEKSTKKK